MTKNDDGVIWRRRKEEQKNTKITQIPRRCKKGMMKNNKIVYRDNFQYGVQWNESSRKIFN